MQQRAAAAGLVIEKKEMPALGEANWRHGPTDSYGQFLHGVYALTHSRFTRTMQLGKGLNEVIDESVIDRCRSDNTYKPQNPGFALP
jgi:hypothetical protein